MFLTCHEIFPRSEVLFGVEITVSNQREPSSFYFIEPERTASNFPSIHAITQFLSALPQVIGLLFKLSS